MKKEIILSELCTNRHGYIKNVGTKDPSMRRRLYDLGFVPGAEVECVMRSPMGDPLAYYVSGSVIALRKNDASSLTLEYEV